MLFQARRQRLRTRLTEQRCFVTASVFDPMSARIAQDLGFEVGIVAGSVAAMATMGAPDLMGLTAGELVDLVRRVGRAGDLSLLVDADDGYGNALDVARTVRGLEEAGAAAMTLEDTLLPLPYGAPRADRLLPLEEGLGKLRAALESRADPDFLVVGRTSAAELTDLDDAIRRLKAYAEAGADAVFPVGLTSRAQVEAVHRSIGRPIILYADRPEFHDHQALAALGVRIVVQPHLPIAAAMKAVYDAMSALREGVAPEALAGLPDAAFMQRITRQAQYDEQLAKYMT